jgi:hypothetical protein
MGGPVATHEPGLQVDTRLFPNPATDIFYIDIIDYVPLDAQLRLYDALGRLVKQERLWQPQTAVSVSDLARGVYMYEIVERLSRSMSREGQRIGQGKVILH